MVVMHIICLLLVFFFRNPQMKKFPFVLSETRWTSGSNFLKEAAFAAHMEKSWPRCYFHHMDDCFIKMFSPRGVRVNSLQSGMLTLCFVFASQAYGAMFCETSAKEGTNIVEAVLHLAR